MTTRATHHTAVPLVPEILDKNGAAENISDVEASAPEVQMDPAEYRRLVRKVDFKLLPILMMLYTVTFLDRVNIGNARLWNLERDLHMKGFEYNIATLVFYIPMVLFEIPSNMLLSRLVPRYYISGLCMAWGLTITFTGFAKNGATLIASRILLGIFEAGMLPACLFLIGSWYKRHALTTRVSWLFVSNDIAGISSGLLGAGLGSLDGTGGYSGWSWIFFVEGAMICVAAAIAFFFLPPFPEQDEHVFKPAEKENYLRMLRTDDRRRTAEKMGFKGSIKATLDWKVICTAWLYLSVTVAAYAISLFLPTVLNGFGWSSLKSNLLSAPVRAVSGVFSVSVGIWSDKTQRRAPFVIGGFTVAIVGNILVVCIAHSNAVQYFGVYLAAIGTYICQGLVIAWGVNQVVGTTKRGTLTAFAGGFAQLGGIIASVAFPKSDGPRYVPGISTCIVFSFSGILAAIVMWVCCGIENRARETGKRDHLRQLSEDEQEQLGEKHPDFRYTL